MNIKRTPLIGEPFISSDATPLEKFKTCSRIEHNPKKYRITTELHLYLNEYSGIIQEAWRKVAIVWKSRKGYSNKSDKRFFKSVGTYTFDQLTPLLWNRYFDKVESKTETINVQKLLFLSKWVFTWLLITSCVRLFEPFSIYVTRKMKKVMWLQN